VCVRSAQARELDMPDKKAGEHGALLPIALHQAAGLRALVGVRNNIAIAKHELVVRATLVEFCGPAAH